MKVFISIAILVSFCLVILSCAENKEEERYRQLRQDVISHYKAENNPLKEKAARFLLDNIKDRYAIEGKRYQVYSDTIKRYYQNADTLYKKLISVKKAAYRDSVVKDITTLNAGYLIDNIDRAFAALEKAGWKDQVSFNDFCEYILPYRIGNEPLENWRKEILQDTIFKITSDTVFTFTDIAKAATYFTKEHSKFKKDFVIKWGGNSANIPDLQYSILHLLTTGTCTDLTHLSLFACRTAAIPIAKDFVPHWANSSGAHDWSAIITKTGSVPFVFPIKDTLGYYKGTEYIHSKIYRSTFTENAQSHAKQRGYCEFLPDVFNNPRVLDVTDLYIHTQNIDIPDVFKTGKEKFAYLAVADRKSWILVGWGKVSKGLANFQKVGGKAVYLPVYTSNTGTQPLNYPFVINEKGEIHYFSPDLNKLRRVELTRKNPLRSRIINFTNRIVHGKFQGASNSDFRNAKDLCEIVKAPKYLFDELKSNTNEKFRYVRYISPENGSCNIAEIHFISAENKPLNGKIIGTPCTWRNSKETTIDKAFDGNVLTYYDSCLPNDGWVGLDLGKPETISKVVYAPRNDDNYIKVGNLYELFYWDNSWKSLGEKTATDQVLIYDKVPSGSLLFLKNHTEGREERIFSYENGEQIWW